MIIITLFSKELPLITGSLVMVIPVVQPIQWGGVTVRVNSTSPMVGAKLSALGLRLERIKTVDVWCSLYSIGCHGWNESLFKIDTSRRKEV